MTKSVREGEKHIVRERELSQEFEQMRPSAISEGCGQQQPMTLADDSTADETATHCDTAIGKLRVRSRALAVKQLEPA